MLERHPGSRSTRERACSFTGCGLSGAANLAAVLGRALLFDVDGTLLDVLGNQKRVSHAWAKRLGLSADAGYTFEVRAVGRGGPDPSPAKSGFKIK